MSTGASMLRESTPVSYTLDARISRFNVKVSAGGPLAKLGHNPTISIRDFSGDVDLLLGQIDQLHSTVKIRAASLTVADDMSSKDRDEIQSNMRKDVLETDRFPEILFESTSIASERVLEGLYRVQVTGNLTLHGVLRKQQITAQVAFVGETVRASGEFALLQSDFNIKQYSVAGGALKVKDELKLVFDIVARKAG
jgi:polyisoprenoid-binding protein YceI